MFAWVDYRQQTNSSCSSTIITASIVVKLKKRHCFCLIVFNCICIYNVHPSISLHLSGVRLWWQQIQQGIPDVSYPNNTFQLILEYPNSGKVLQLLVVSFIRVFQIIFSLISLLGPICFERPYNGLLAWTAQLPGLQDIVGLPQLTP